MLAFAALPSASHAAPAPASQTTPRPLRWLVDPPPLSLNPRASVDATGQRLIALIFRGLTRLDADLTPVADLALEWTSSRNGTEWRFRLRPDAVDHGGQPITATRMAACLESYRVGKPISPLRSAIPSWIATEARGDELVVRLERPDPYLLRNLSALRYFRTEAPGAEAQPCSEPASGAALIGSGPLRPARWDASPQTELRLLPTAPGQPAIDIVFLQDENTKLLKLLHGDIDVALNTLSLTKTRWLARNHGDRFRFVDRPGSRVSYLAFNLKDPLLSRREVREALSLAIDRANASQTKLLGYGTLAGSLLSPLLPESHPVEFPFDPARAERLLDQAGLRRDAEGVRFRLRYKTTPAREGLEMALVFQEMLRRVGVELQLEIVEPAVFFASIRKGNFQLFSSRWLGVADGSILQHALRAGQPGNRGGYDHAETNRLLDLAAREPVLEKRKALLREVQLVAARELPVLPLWYWSSTLILSNGITPLRETDLSLSGAYEPLLSLRALE